MSNKMIYDRVEFCNKIIELIENSEKTNAFILYSQVGVGKSSVCKKIESIINCSNNKNVICVSTAQENQKIQEGAFLKSIFKHINRYYEKKIRESGFKNKHEYSRYTFSAYLRKNEGFSTIIKCLYDYSGDVNISLENIPYLIFNGIKCILGYILLKVGVTKKSRDISLHNNRLISNYIKYVLNSGNIILNIDNIQNFDDVSLDYFVECLLDTKDKNNFMLLEFTLLEDNSNYHYLQKFKNELNNADIKNTSLQLKNLDIKNVIKIAYAHCNKEDGLFELAVRNNYEKKYKGNLKKVEHFASLYSDSISLETDPTYVKINNLTSNQKYVLAIIIINNALLKTQVLKYIIENSNSDFMVNFTVDVIDFCKQGEVIEEVDGEIKIIHSSFIDVWYENIGVFKKYELVAYRNCKKIYEKILSNKLFYTLSKEECLLLLFQLYSKFDIGRLSDILFQIDEIVYDFLSIDNLQKYLKKLLDFINDSEAVIPFLYKITDICIKYQMYNLEAYCLQKISKILGNTFNEKFQLYQYIKMFQEEDYEELLFTIEQDKQLAVSSEFKAYNILFEIISYRTLNNYEKCFELVSLIEKNDVFKKTVYYAYFLRLAEAYDKRNIAISKVEQSIALFKKFNLPIQVAKSQVSLAFLYAVTGKIDDAIYVLNAAETVLLKNIENRYVFNINKACINLLSDDFSNDVWLLLDEAEKYTHMKFDRIAIIINKIIWCIENLDYTKGNYLQNKGLELLETESDKHIHAIFYYNCYVLNKVFGKLDKQKYFYNLAYENKNYCETLKARLENKEHVEDNTTFLLSKSWHVCFVSYWYFDYLGDLE